MHNSLVYESLFDLEKIHEVGPLCSLPSYMAYVKHIWIIFHIWHIYESYMEGLNPWILNHSTTVLIHGRSGTVGEEHQLKHPAVHGGLYEAYMTHIWLLLFSNHIWRTLATVYFFITHVIWDIYEIATPYMCYCHISDIYDAYMTHLWQKYDQYIWIIYVSYMQPYIWGMYEPFSMGKLGRGGKSGDGRWKGAAEWHHSYRVTLLLSGR